MLGQAVWGRLQPKSKAQCRPCEGTLGSTLSFLQGKAVKAALAPQLPLPEEQTPGPHGQACPSLQTLASPDPAGPRMRLGFLNCVQLPPLSQQKGCSEVLSRP